MPKAITSLPFYFINSVATYPSAVHVLGKGGGVYPNLLSAGPPFQIDGNFGAGAGIAEMLLQSHEGFIYLLPAIPDEWKAEGSVKGMKARGNITVDFKWEKGQVTQYSVSSPIRQKVQVKINGHIKQLSL